MLALPPHGHFSEAKKGRMTLPDPRISSDEMFSAGQSELREICAELQSKSLSVKETISALGRFSELCTTVVITRDELEFLFLIIANSSIPIAKSLAMESARLILLCNPRLATEVIDSASLIPLLNLIDRPLSLEEFSSSTACFRAIRW
jgi:hypothetical protein